jgi:hypothetical protein
MSGTAVGINVADFSFELVPPRVGIEEGSSERRTVGADVATLCSITGTTGADVGGIETGASLTGVLGIGVGASVGAGLVGLEKGFDTVGTSLG